MMLTRLQVGLLAVLSTVSNPMGAVAQDQVAMAHAPRFLRLAPGSKTLEAVDVSRTAALRQRVSLNHDRQTVAQLLASISRQTGLEFAYNVDVVNTDRVVPLKAESITVAAALTEILADAGVDVVLRAGRQVALMRRGATIRFGTVTGRVTDAKTGGQITSAEVWLDGTRWRTTTDTNGRYSLADVDAGNYTLSARRLGYAKWSRAITIREGQADTVDVTLDPVATRLDELVSTATGMRRRMDIANDVTTINADSVVRTQPITSVTDLLETRVPGLTVQRTSGAPGDPARLRLRGAGSPLHNNDPIVIVDGIRVYAEQSAGRSANLASRTSRSDTSNTDNYAAPSPLDYIDPNTIETIEVIKGPSAATLYGPDAANGVIVITTKKGKAGPTRWTFTADHGTSRVPGEFPDLTVRWGHTLYHPDIQIVCGTGNVIAGLGLGNTGCDADSVVRYQILNDPALTVLDHGNRNAFTLGASGGTQALTYAVTGSYQREVGLFKLPGYEVDQYVAAHSGQSPPDWTKRPQQLNQWGVTSNLKARLGATADVTLSAMFSSTSQDRSSLERQMGTLLTTYFDRASDTYYGSNATGAIFAPVNQDILTGYYQRATTNALQFTNGLNLSWRLRPWLTMTGDAGLNIDQRDDEILLPRGAVNGGGDSVGTLANGHGRSLVSTVNMRGVAVVPVGLGLKLNLGAGVNYKGESIGDLMLGSRWLPVGTTLIGDSVTSKFRTVEDNATFGWYVEQSLTHRKFSFSTGLRLDGGSNYGSRVSTSGGLPKLGFSYLVSDEPFFPFKDLFQSFRLRAAYGRASRQPGITDRLRLYSAATTATVGGQSAGVSELANLGNTELRPERSTEFEGGFDTDLLDSRVSLTVSWYRKTTDDALLPVPLAPSVYGYNSGITPVTIMKNIGVVRNTGIDMTASTQLVRSRPVTLGADLSVSRNRSLVVKLAPGVLPFFVESFSDNGIRVAPGYPLFSRWTKPILGYADANGNGALETSEVVVGDTAVYMGSAVPNYLVDLRANLSLWQGAVTLSAGLHYDDGLTQLNELARRLSPYAAARNSASATLADQAAVIDMGASVPYNWYQTVNVVRFQNISLGYRIPQTLARRVGAQTLTVMVQGTNLGLWTNYRGLDPNVNAYATGNTAISDNGVLPQPRNWQVRVNATY